MAAKDLNAILKDMNGKPLSKENGDPSSVKDIAIAALCGQYADEQSLSGDDKFKRFELAMRINAGECELSPEEIVLIKKLVGKGWGPLVVGGVYQVLNA